MSTKAKLRVVRSVPPSRSRVRGCKHTTIVIDVQPGKDPPTMAQPNTLVLVDITVGADMPAGSYTALNGRTIAFRPEDVNNVGSGPDVPGVLMGIRGYRTNANPGSPAQFGFIFTGEFSQTTLTAFLAIPGQDGWSSGAARNQFRNALTQLVDQYQVPLNAALELGRVLYAATKTDRNAHG